MEKSDNFMEVKLVKCLLLVMLLGPRHWYNSIQQHVLQLPDSLHGARASGAGRQCHPGADPCPRRVLRLRQEHHHTTHTEILRPAERNCGEFFSHLKKYNEIIL